jgi:hypothetical protein
MIQCCNFLRVSRMSEIATGCGSRILPRIYNGDEPESNATNQWQIQPRPPKGAWTIWKKYLGFMVMSQTTLALSQPLGKWKKELPRTPWKYHEPSDHMYFQHSQGTTEYHRIRRSSEELFKQEKSTIQYGTFEKHLEAQQQYAWLFRHPLCSIKFQDLVDAIEEGRDIAISDGSHKNKWGTTSSRIMTDTNEALQWTCLHVTPGIKDDQFAFRIEIGGIYDMSVAIELVCKFFQISNGSVSFGSDCEAALEQQIILI